MHYSKTFYVEYEKKQEQKYSTSHDDLTRSKRKKKQAVNLKRARIIKYGMRGLADAY